MLEWWKSFSPGEVSHSYLYKRYRWCLPHSPPGGLACSLDASSYSQFDLGVSTASRSAVLGSIPSSDKLWKFTTYHKVSSDQGHKIMEVCLLELDLQYMKPDINMPFCYSNPGHLLSIPVPGLQGTCGLPKNDHVNEPESEVYPKMSPG